MALARPDTCEAVRLLLVSMPSVNTTMARCDVARSANRRAVAAVASYSDVLPNGSKSDNASFSESMLRSLDARATTRRR